MISVITNILNKAAQKGPVALTGMMIGGMVAMPAVLGAFGLDVGIVDDALHVIVGAVIILVTYTVYSIAECIQCYLDCLD